MKETRMDHEDRADALLEKGAVALITIWLIASLALCTWSVVWAW